jgi:DNA-binding MarR family transcriptional regulator
MKNIRKEESTLAKKTNTGGPAIEADGFSLLRKKVLDTLDNQSSINIQMNFWFDEMMKHYEVNYSIYRIMRILRKYPAGVEPSVVADRLTLLRQTVTNMVDDLEKKGLVNRSPHPNDRRRIFIMLTEAGSQLANTLTKEMTSLEDDVLKKFTKAEMETYLDIRTRIIQYTESEIKDRYFSESE